MDRAFSSSALHACDIQFVRSLHLKSQIKGYALRAQNGVSQGLHRILKVGTALWPQRRQPRRSFAQ